MVASAEVVIQMSVTSRKPSLGFSSRRQPVVAAIVSNPVPVLAAAPTTKYSASPSPEKIEQISGRAYVAPKNASNSPRTFATASIRQFLTRRLQEQSLDRIEVPSVR